MMMRRRMTMMMRMMMARMGMRKPICVPVQGEKDAQKCKQTKRHTHSKDKNTRANK